MLSIRINDLKRFTSLLFAEDAFDKFCLHDAVFKTAYTTAIDGGRNMEFYGEETDPPKTSRVLWSEARPSCYALIRGSRLPVSFKLVLLTQEEATQLMVQRSGFTDCGVASLTLNITYKDNSLFLTSGVSYLGFSLEKSLEKYWDSAVVSFLERHGITYTDA